MYVDEVGNPDLDNSDNPNHRFLSLTGIIISLDYVKDVLHPEMEAMKVKHFGAHPDDPVIAWRYDPYHYCLAVLLERFNFWLNRENSVGDVMAESRGGKEDIRLKDSFHRLWKQGTDFVGPEQFQKSLTSKQLKVKPKSANVSGLQLADIIAHPSRAEILDAEGLLGRPLATFSKKVIDLLQDKYDRQGERVFGKKFI